MPLALRRYGGIAVALAAAGALVVGAASFLISPEYEAAGAVRVRMAEPATTVKGYAARADYIYGLIAVVLQRPALKGVIKKEGLYPLERTKIPLEDVVDEMRRNIRFGGYDPAGTDTYEVRFKYRDAARAQRTASDLISALMEEDRKTSGGSPALTLLKAPSVPRRPVIPNRLRLAALGGCAALLLGVVGLAVRRWPTAAAWGVYGALLGLGVSFLLPDEYVATRTFQVMAEAPVAPAAIARILDRQANGGVLPKIRVLKATVTAPAGVEWLQISSTAPTPEEARKALGDVKKTIERAVSPPGKVMLLDVRDKQTGPKHWFGAVMGFVAGILMRLGVRARRCVSKNQIR